MKATLNGITFDGTPDEIMSFLAKYRGDDAEKKTAPATDTMTGELFEDGAVAMVKDEIVEALPVTSGGLAVVAAPAPTETKRQRRRRGAVVCWHQTGRERPLKFYRRLADLLAEYGIDDSYTGREAAVRIAKVAAERYYGKIASVTMWSADGFAECWMFDREGKLTNESVARIAAVEAEAGNADAE